MSKDHFNVEERVFPGSHIREYPGSTAESQEDILYLHAKKYTPLHQTSPLPRDAITIIAAHASGFPKELYEPLFDELLQRSHRNGFTIRSIWISDTANFGQSGVINENLLSSDYSWHDHARDLLLMVNQYRAEMPRPIFGLGHSFGGNELCNLALLHPRLLAGLVLMDASIHNRAPTAHLSSGHRSGFNHLLYKQDVFKTRLEAAQMLKKNPLYRRFDPRVHDRMVKFGFRDLPTALHPELPKNADPTDPPVTYTATIHQDALTSFRSNFSPRMVDGRAAIDRDTHADMDPAIADIPFYRPEPRLAYERLPSLRPMTAFVLGEKTYLPVDRIREGIRTAGTGMSGSGGVAEGRVKEITIPGGPHLFPLYMPNETADAVAPWLGEALHMYRADEAKWEASRVGRTKVDDLRLGKTWYELVKPPQSSREPKAGNGSKI